MLKLDKGKVERALLDGGLSTKRVVKLSKLIMSRDLTEDEPVVDTTMKKRTVKEVLAN